METYHFPTRYAVASKARKAEDTAHYGAQVGDVQELERHVALAARSGKSHSLAFLEQREGSMGMMPLHVACEHGSLAVVQYLIDKGVRVNEGDSSGITPLHLACIGNQRDICSCLLAAHASPSSQDSEGDTPLHWAATKGHCDVIDLLLQHQSPLDPMNHLGWTPLHRAAFNGRRQAVERLAGRGASILVQNREGNTPLHLACQANQYPVIELLLSVGAKVDTRNNQGKSPLDLCITDKARDMLQPPGGARALLPGDPELQQAGNAAHEQHLGPGRAEAAAEAAAPAGTSTSTSLTDGDRSWTPALGEGSLSMTRDFRTLGQAPGHSTDVDWVAAHVASSVSALRLGTGPALPPVGRSSGSGLEEPQHPLINEDNKQVVEALMQRRRPTSANKRFLEKYSLDKLNLFAPA